MRAWIDWYDSPHTIYANDHHRDVHFRHIAEEKFGTNPDATRIMAGWRSLMDQRRCATTSKVIGSKVVEMVADMKFS